MFFKKRSSVVTGLRDVVHRFVTPVGGADAGRSLVLLVLQSGAGGPCAGYFFIREQNLFLLISVAFRSAFEGSLLPWKCAGFASSRRRLVWNFVTCLA